MGIKGLVRQIFHDGYAGVVPVLLQLPPDRHVFIPRSLILDSDTDLDEIAQGEEVTIEIPRWKARELGLVE